MGSGELVDIGLCLAALLDHLSQVEDPRDVRRILHPLPEVLLLVVCGTIADCDDYEDIATWGGAHLDFLRQHLPYEHGVPGERWLTILMNRINPTLFAAAFAAWHSKARNARGKVEVHVCRAADVRKPRGVPAGTVELRRWDVVRVYPREIAGL